MDTFTIIQNEIVSQNDLSLLGVQCYVCQRTGHLSVDCSLFIGIKGNLKKLVKEPQRKKSQEKLSKTHTSVSANKSNIDSSSQEEKLQIQFEKKPEVKTGAEIEMKAFFEN